MKKRFVTIDVNDLRMLLFWARVGVGMVRGGGYQNKIIGTIKYWKGCIRFKDIDPEFGKDLPPIKKATVRG